MVHDGSEEKEKGQLAIAGGDNVCLSRARESKYPMSPLRKDSSLHALENRA